eukprot:543948-Amphidinium_carterae.2
MRGIEPGKEPWGVHGCPMNSCAAPCVAASLLQPCNQVDGACVRNGRCIPRKHCALGTDSTRTQFGRRLIV